MFVTIKVVNELIVVSHFVSFITHGGHLDHVFLRKNVHESHHRRQERDDDTLLPRSCRWEVIDDRLSVTVVRMCRPVNTSQMSASLTAASTWLTPNGARSRRPMNTVWRPLKKTAVECRWSLLSPDCFVSNYMTPTIPRIISLWLPGAVRTHHRLRALSRMPNYCCI